MLPEMHSMWGQLRGRQAQGALSTAPVTPHSHTGGGGAGGRGMANLQQMQQPALGQHAHFTHQWGECMLRSSSPVYPAIKQGARQAAGGSIAYPTPWTLSWAQILHDNNNLRSNLHKLIFLHTLCHGDIAAMNRGTLRSSRACASWQMSLAHSSQGTCSSPPCRRRAGERREGDEGWDEDWRAKG